MSEPSIDRGPLRLNAIGRWEILLRGSSPIELSSGDVIFVESDGAWKLTRIEYAHGPGPGEGRYVSVDGYHLADGVMAALPT